MRNRRKNWREITERQTGVSTSEIRRDHVDRYVWAVGRLNRMGVGRSVIDAGCGVGYGTQILARHGFDVTAIDIDRAALAHARKHFRGAINYWPMDMGHLEVSGEDNKTPFPKSETMVAFEFIEHILCRYSFLHLAARACRYGLFSVPNEDAIPWNKEKFPEHLLHFHAEDFERLLSDAGWTVLSRHGQIGKYGVVFPTEGEPTWERLLPLNPRTLVVIAQSTLVEGDL